MALAVVSTPMQSLRSRFETTRRLVLLVWSTQSPVRTTWSWRYHQLQLVLKDAVAVWARAAMAVRMRCLGSMFVCFLVRVLSVGWFCVF